MTKDQRERPDGRSSLHRSLVRYSRSFSTSSEQLQPVSIHPPKRFKFKSNRARCIPRSNVGLRVHVERQELNVNPSRPTGLAGVRGARRFPSSPQCLGRAATMRDADVDPSRNTGVLQRPSHPLAPFLQASVLETSLHITGRFKADFRLGPEHRSRRPPLAKHH